MDVIGDGFRAQNADTRDLIETLSTGTFAPDQFKWDTKYATFWPGDLKHAGILEGSKRLRRKGICHEFSVQLK